MTATELYEKSWICALMADDVCMAAGKSPENIIPNKYFYTF